jgi:acyl-CoA thioesterase FadM
MKYVLPIHLNDTITVQVLDKEINEGSINFKLVMKDKKKHRKVAVSEISVRYEDAVESEGAYQ